MDNFNGNFPYMGVFIPSFLHNQNVKPSTNSKHISVSNLGGFFNLRQRQKFNFEIIVVSLGLNQQTVTM